MKVEIPGAPLIPIEFIETCCDIIHKPNDLIPVVSSGTDLLKVLTTLKEAEGMICPQHTKTIYMVQHPQFRCLKWPLLIGIPRGSRYQVSLCMDCVGTVGTRFCDFGFAEGQMG